MTLEELKEIGIEEDIASKVMAIAPNDDSMNDGETVKKSDYDKLKNDFDTIKSAMEEQNNALSKLFVGVSGDDFKTKAQNFQENLKKAEDETKKALEKNKLDYHVKLAIKDSGTNDSEVVEMLLGKKTLKLDGDKVVGLDDYLKEIKDSKPHLFGNGQNHHIPTNFKTKTPTDVHMVAPAKLTRYQNQLAQARKSGDLEAQISILQEAGENGVLLR